MIKLSRLHNSTEVWTYQNFLDTNVHQLIKLYLDNLKNEIIDNFEGRTISYGENTYRLKDTAEHRQYHTLWNLSYIPEYWDQTNTTIFKWVENQSRQLMHPAVKLLIDKTLSTLPFSEYQGNWIAFRGIFNLLKPGISLDPHLDASLYVMDCDKYPTYSATYYVDVLGDGGEFWDETGFMYKPSNNSLLVNIGSKYTHGVRPSTDYRLGITVRFIKETDLLLPGNVDELLYKPSF